MAFCLYNLSSIINGLVYFDQFSALSTLNLLLVMLGMIILLAGVWVVSFPPGGNRGIDVGTWGEPEEIQMDQSDTGEDFNEPYEDEPLPMAGTQVGSRNAYHLDEDERDHIVFTRRSESPTQSSLQINTSISNHDGPPEVHTGVRDSPTSARSSHGRRQTDSALLSSTYDAPLNSPTTPTRRRRPTLGPHTHSSSGPTTPPRMSFPTFAHPLSPGTSTLSGFSIGLSPVSPGFALVPRRRRMTSAEGLLAGEAGSGVRRTVSESGAGRVVQLPAPVSAPEGVEAAHAPSAPEERPKGGRRWRVLSSLLELGRRR